MKVENVIVLFGGSSSERLVATASSQNILLAIPRAQAWYIAKDGSVFICKREDVISHQNVFKEELKVSGTSHFRSIEDSLKDPKLKSYVFVLSLHGVGVEDGVLQGKLEKAGVAYTGSSARASALAFDKLASKEVAKTNGVRVAQHLELQGRDSNEIQKSLLRFQAQHMKLALKPVADGSSTGLKILTKSSEVLDIATMIASEGRRYMAEEFLEGTELTVGVVGDGKNAKALTPSEVRLATGANFDYDAKYLGRGVEELTPARVSPEVTCAAQELAVTMHRALGCEGYSRTDLIVTQEGPYYLETNTLPGMTRASFFPQQLNASGSSIQEFFENEIERAWKKVHP